MNRPIPVIDPKIPLKIWVNRMAYNLQAFWSANSGKTCRMISGRGNRFSRVYAMNRQLPMFGENSTKGAQAGM